MFKKIISLSVAVFLSTTVFSQKVYTATDVFTEKNISWYGIDFTHCKFIGQPTIHGKFYKEPAFVVKYYFKDWNIIPVKESEKYDIKGTFRKEYVYYDIDTLVERNSRYNPDSLVAITHSYSISEDAIQGIVKTYGGITKEGIGVAYIAEKYNSETDIATYFVVIFDIASKKVFFKERVTGKAGGATLKTFWAGAFHNALEMNRKIYGKWRKETLVR